MFTKRRTACLFSIALLMALFVCDGSDSVQAGLIQIGDFRINSGDVSTATAFDPGTTFTTRGVSGAPIQIVSDFSVGSQNADGTLSTAEDVILQTFSSVTRIRNLSRFTPSDVAGAGVQRVGMAEWSFSLSSIDSYLSANSLALTALDLDLFSTNSDTGKELDVYLSYTNPAESIVLTDIDSTNSGAGSTNWTDFYLPARGAAVGDIVGGSHKLLQLDTTGNLNVSESLLSLYNSGVRDFSLSIAGGDFWSGRNIDITNGAGISFTTTAVPEPSGCMLMLVFSVGAIASRRRKRTA